jgi:hypothetical protein
LPNLRRRLVPAILAAAAIAFFALTAGPPPAKPNPPGTFSFAALGDAPYYSHEALQYRVVLRALNENDLTAVIHIGDIFWRPCSDEMYAKTRRGFDSVRHPLIYTPGDNEWTDCWEERVGGYAPLDRLARIRQVFYNHPTRSLGATPIPLVSQGGEFVENARWEQNGIVFATVHLVGSLDATWKFPGRTAADDEAAARRLAADVVWLRETFANAANAKAVVIAFHAGTHLELPPGHDWRKPFEPFLAALEQEAARFGKPVLVIHGDDHVYTVDHPIPRIPNLTRMEVPGSPRVGWVRVTVNLAAAQPFSFENYVVPRWKYW